MPGLITELILPSSWRDAIQSEPGAPYPLVLWLRRSCFSQLSEKSYLMIHQETLDFSPPPGTLLPVSPSGAKPSEFSNCSFPSYPPVTPGEGCWALRQLLTSWADGYGKECLPRPSSVFTNPVPPGSSSPNRFGPFALRVWLLAVGEEGCGKLPPPVRSWVGGRRTMTRGAAFCEELSGDGRQGSSLGGE